MGRPILHRQPFKAVYLIFAFIHLFLFLLPAWTIHNIRPSRRPFQSWTLMRAIYVNFLRWFTAVAFRVNRFNKRDLTVGATEKELEGTNASFVWMPPLDHEPKGKVGEWVSETGTTAISLPAYWFGAIDAAGRRDYRPTSPNEKVLIRFHGGAYVVGSAYPTEIGAYIPMRLCELSKSLTRALSVEYRLSSSDPNPVLHPFPAALVDAISAYYYVISLGVASSNIYITGGSAGGNLALALVRYLVENDLPRPGGLILCSPWCDLTGSDQGPESSYVRNEHADYLLSWTSKLTPYTLRAFLGGLPASNPYISPACRTLEPKPSFAGFPRTYIAVGSGEKLLDQIRTLKNYMTGQVEDGVVYDETEGAMHDFLVFWFMQQEREATMHRIAKWIDAE